jgi:hypothetical protein
MAQSSFEDPRSLVVAFVGVGQQGTPMAANLIAAGSPRRWPGSTIRAPTYPGRWKARRQPANRLRAQNRNRPRTRLRPRR